MRPLIEETPAGNAREARDEVERMKYEAGLTLASRAASTWTAGRFVTLRLEQARVADVQESAVVLGPTEDAHAVQRTRWAVIRDERQRSFS